jgi:hypothetical protein
MPCQTIFERFLVLGDVGSWRSEALRPRKEGQRGGAKVPRDLEMNAAQTVVRVFRIVRRDFTARGITACTTT